MPEIDGSEVVRAVKEMIKDEGAYQCLTTARAALREAELGHWDFGAVGGLFIADGYDKARTYHIENLGKGVDKFKAMVAGLNQVAINHHAVEQANIIDGPTVGAARPGVEHVPSAEDTRAVKGAALLVMFELAAQYWAVAAILGTASAMAPAAVAGAVAWLAFAPNDGSLNEAATRWQQAHDELQIFANQLAPALRVLDGAWTGVDKTTFDGFVSTFSNEVLQTLDAVNACKETFAGTAQTLDQLQNAFFTQAVAALGAILAAQALARLPVVGIVFEQVKQHIGGLLTVTTLGVVGIIIHALWDAGKAMLAASQTTFQSSHPNADGSGVDFRDVKIDLEWATI